jgi:hypothetical protein
MGRPPRHAPEAGNAVSPAAIEPHHHEPALRVIDQHGELITTVARSTGEISQFKAHGSKHLR